VSHETIYRSLFVQARGVLKKELLGHLRSKRTIRRSKPADPNGDRRGHIKDLVSISARPATVEDRAVPGHWEGDLLSGSKNSYIATLVERHTRYVMLTKVANKDTQTVVSALIKQAKTLPNELYKSLTWDRGKELAEHRRFTLATNIEVYFCDPQSPWQRGSNENTNGLLRQYLPSGTDLSVYSQAHLNKVARQLNERPRKTLGFETPAERFSPSYSPKIAAWRDLRQDFARGAWRVDRVRRLMTRRLGLILLGWKFRRGVGCGDGAALAMALRRRAVRRVRGRQRGRDKR
jgi:IS30 family transposase